MSQASNGDIIALEASLPIDAEAKPKANAIIIIHDATVLYDLP